MVKRKAVRFMGCVGEDVFIIPAEVSAVEGTDNNHIVEVHLKGGTTVLVEGEPKEVMESLGLW